MAYELQNGNIIQVTAVYAQSGVVEMQNVLHYRLVSGGPIPDGADAIQDVLTYMAANTVVGRFSKHWADIAADVVQLDRFWGQRIYPVRYAKIELDTSIAGVNTEEPVPPPIQGAITKRGEVAARYAVGGIRVPGIASVFEVNGQLTAPGLTALQVLADTLASNIISTGPTATWEPVIYRRTNAGSSVRVTQVTAHQVMRTQRTRIPGKGV